MQNKMHQNRSEKVCQGGSAPLNSPVLGVVCTHCTCPHRGLRPQGCFLIESPQTAGYRVSLVSVSESGSQTVGDSRLMPQFTRNFDYKIDHIYKNHKNLKISSAFVSKYYASFVMKFDIFGPLFWSKCLNLLFQGHKS